MTAAPPAPGETPTCPRGLPIVATGTTTSQRPAQHARPARRRLQPEVVCVLIGMASAAAVGVAPLRWCLDLCVVTIASAVMAALDAAHDPGTIGRHPSAVAVVLGAALLALAALAVVVRAGRKATR